MESKGKMKKRPVSAAARVQKEGFNRFRNGVVELLSKINLTANALAALIESRGWTTVALVSSRPGLSRTALQAKRCTTATVLRRAAPCHDGVELAVAAVAEAPRYLQALVFQQQC